MLAAIRIRSASRLHISLKDTLVKLGLLNQHNMGVFADTSSIRGMLFKVKDYIAWGELSDEMLATLRKKSKDAKIFRLNPPRGGYERKGIKAAYAVGGASGYRGEAINALIKRML